MVSIFFVTLFACFVFGYSYPVQIYTSRGNGPLVRAKHKQARISASGEHTSKSQALGLFLFVLRQAVRLHGARSSRTFASKGLSSRAPRVVSTFASLTAAEMGNGDKERSAGNARHVPTSVMPSDRTSSHGMVSKELNSGHLIPMVGLGTWKSKPGEVREAVEIAIDSGYRHIDCAPIYGNEKEVGEALQRKIDEGVRREDLFVVSKLWNTEHQQNHVRSACEQTLRDLRLEYLDLYLMHWPFAFQHGGEMIPRRQDGSVIYDEDTDYAETWAAMEKLVDEGLVRAIGVCNFNSTQIKRITEMCRIKPATLQVESHPYFDQSDLLTICKEYGIPLTAYCPLGSADNPARKESDPILLEDVVLEAIGKKYDKSSAQVCIRWQIQRGVIVLPKSVNARRIAENLDVFDFELDVDDMADIAKLNRNWRLNECVITINGELRRRDASHKYYPFAEQVSTS